MANEKRLDLIDRKALLEELDKFANPMPNKSGYDFLCGIATAITEIEDAPTVEAVEVVRCAYCDPGSRDYNPCWLCKKGGTAHDVEHCHVTNYRDYEPMQPHCHLCGRKL